MKKLLVGLCAAVCVAKVFSGSLSAGVRVAVLKGRGDCDRDFDRALADCGVTAARFACTAAGMKDFTAHLGDLDLALIVPLFNYAGAKNMLKDGDTDFASIRGWIEKGGVLVVSEANYLNARGWVENVAPEVKGLTTSKCTSSQWAVMGHVKSEEPRHALRMFPNAITEGDSWPHFDEPPSDHPATVLARCSEGKPVSLLFEIGKGAIVLTTLRQPQTANLENYIAFALLRRAGLSVADYSQTPIAVGAGHLRMKLASPPSEAAALELTLLPEKGGARTFRAEFKGDVAEMDYRISVRGKVEVTLNAVTGTKKVPLFSRKAVLPELLTLRGSDYRGIVSTARRSSSVPIRLAFAPDAEDLHGADIALALVDAQGVVVTNAVGTLAATGAVDTATLKLVLPAKLAAGDYALRAVLKKDALAITATNALTVLAPRPAQCVVDADRTLLVDGKPFFPLGIYHAVGDYDRPVEIGFNAVQFWKWEMKPDRFGMQTGLHRAAGRGLRCLFESNHSGEGVWKACAVQAADNPALLLWSVDDEPSEADAEAIRVCHAGWHRYDLQHPTLLTSCRPDLFAEQARACDVFAFDPYGSKETPFDAVAKTVDWCRRAQAATEGRQPLVLVPHAFPSDRGVLRPVAYAGLVHDVRGIFWYCWKQTSGGKVGVGLHAHPEHQTEISNLICEVKTLLPGLCSPYRRPFEAGAIHGLVTGRPKKWAEHFIILVNVTGEMVEADFTVPEAHFRKALQRVFVGKVPALDKEGLQRKDARGRLVYEEPYEPIAGPGRLKRTFKPYETVVYRW